MSNYTLFLQKIKSPLRIFKSLLTPHLFSFKNGAFNNYPIPTKKRVFSFKGLLADT